MNIKRKIPQLIAILLAALMIVTMIPETAYASVPRMGTVRDEVSTGVQPTDLLDEQPEETSDAQTEEDTDEEEKDIIDEPEEESEEVQEGEKETPEVPARRNVPEGDGPKRVNRSASEPKDIATETRYEFLDTVFKDKGVLTADTQSAAAGETVTLTLTLDDPDNYGLKPNGIKAYDGYSSSAEEIPLTLTEESDNSWTFEMPEGDYDFCLIVAEIEWLWLPIPEGSSYADYTTEFYFKDGIEHGRVFAKYQDSVNNAGEVTVYPAHGRRPIKPPCTVELKAVPDDGYELKEWLVEVIQNTGQPSGFTLPVEHVGDTDVFAVEKYFNGGTLSFRIDAVFEEQEEPVLEPHIITVKDNIQMLPNCTVTTNPETAVQGEEVTINLDLAPGVTVEPIAGRDMEVYYELPNSDPVYIDITKVDDTTYTFVMPNADVKIIPRLKYISYTITPTPLSNGQGVQYLYFRNSRDNFIGSGYYNPGSNTWNKGTGPEVWTAGVGETVIIRVLLVADSHEMAPASITFYDAETGEQVGEPVTEMYTSFTGTEYDFSATMPAADVRFTVQMVPRYNIIREQTDHGKFSANCLSARKGDTVTITAVPDDPYEYTGVVWDVTWEDAEGTKHPLEVTENPSGSMKADFVMPEGPVTVNGEIYAETWRGLQERIDNAEQSKTITLRKDYTAQSEDTRLTVDGKDITIDLNGHTINRDLSRLDGSGGNVFYVNNGTLTITDTSDEQTGRLTGGYAEKGGAVFLNSGTLNLCGGNVTGNNASTYGGAVFCSENSTLNVQGNVVVKNNSAPFGNGIYLAGTNVIHVQGALSSGAELDFAAKQNERIVTEGLPGNGNLSNFTYNGNAELLSLEDGEVYVNAVIADVYVDDWDALQAAMMNSANQGKVIALRKDLSGTGKDRLLLEGSGKNVTVDLAGHTVDLRRGSSGKTMHVFEAKGGATLTIRDSYGTGVITRGWAVNGGGIYVNDDSTVILENVSVKGNKADSDGGGIYVRGTLQMKGGCVEGNTAYDDAGGIYVHEHGKILLSDASISLNVSDDYGAGLNIHARDNSSVIDNCRISNNRSYWESGGGLVFNQSGKTITLNNVVISGNQSDNDGGGIYVQRGTVKITGENTLISDNRAYESGGGIHIDGTLIMEDGTISRNYAAKRGGGIYVYGTATLSGGAIINNQAQYDGGGISIDEDDGKVNVSGKLAVYDNDATRGNDVYLYGTDKLTVSGAFEDGAEIGISLENDASGTVFTSGYAAKNPNGSPANVFFSNDGYLIYLKNGEAAIRIQQPDDTQFIPTNQQIQTNTRRLTSKNWMSGISGERYLNEINMPGSHDSGMNNVQHLDPSTTFLNHDLTSPVAYFFPDVGRAFAKTQNKYINEQFNEGARQIDIRLNDRHKKNITVGWTWTDDGKNLWICHGKKAGGTYFAQTENDKDLSFKQVLTWAKEFLTKHPTETIILDIRPETEDAEHMRAIYMRAKTILEEETLQVNPSTGEYYLYKEPGSYSYFAPYTHIPQLKDCRGKIVIQPNNQDFVWHVGGYTLYSFADTLDVWDDLDYKQSSSEMVDQATSEYSRRNGDGHVRIPNDADGRCDYLWYWELNCTGEGYWGIPWNYVMGEAPHKMANDVNPKMVGSGKPFDPGKTGQYIGWVRFDNFEEKYAEMIWRTNFSDRMEYCDIIVRSGLDESAYPTQTYRVLKGTTINIPGNIYKNVAGKYLGYWAATGDSTSEDCRPGSSFKVNESVSFTAQWLEEGQVPVSIIWKDGENADQLRPDSVGLNVETQAGRVLALPTAERGWREIVTVMGNVTGIVPRSSSSFQIDKTPEHPFGRDTEGQYRYEFDLVEGDGYVLTFYHTPQTKTEAVGKITWDDQDNADGLRPESVTVRLLGNGSETDSVTVSAANSWHFAFSNIPEYVNGEAVEYTIAVDEDGLDEYAVFVDGFDVTCTHTVIDDTLVPLMGIVEWDDAHDERKLRPKEVTVRLLKDGAEIDTQLVKEDEAMLDWGFSFGDIKSDEVNSYSVKIDDVSGYTFVVDDSEAPIYRIIGTIEAAEDKEPAEITTEPAARELTWTGEEQTLIEAGEAEGGILLYALGDSADTPPDETEFSTKLPEAKNAGTYHVWYYVQGDVLHTSTEPTCIAASIGKAKQNIEAEDISATAGETGHKIEAYVTGVGDTEEGLGTLSYEVTEGEDVVSVEPDTGELTLHKAGTATVTVSVEETDNYNPATREVTITVNPKAKADKPDAPEAEAKNATTVAIDDADDTLEYALVPKGEGAPAEDSDAWKAPEDGAVEWTGLEANKEYEVYARVKETDDKAASDPSDAKTVKTPKAKADKPDAPEAEAKDATTVAVENADDTLEYALVPKGEGAPAEDSDDWISPEDGAVEWTGLEANTEYEVYARVKETDNKAASDPSDSKTVKTPPEEGEEISYSNTEGDGTTWTKGSNVTADFTFKRSVEDSTTFSHFTGISVDDGAVDEANYTKESGSVIVKLKPEYLETLALGDHTITAHFNDGNSPSAAFKIVEAENPNDPDDGNNDDQNPDDPDDGNNDDQNPDDPDDGNNDDQNPDDQDDGNNDDQNPDDQDGGNNDDQNPDDQDGGNNDGQNDDGNKDNVTPDDQNNGNNSNGGTNKTNSGTNKTNGTSSANGKKAAPRTGDESNMALWLLLAGASAAVMTLLAKRRRKESK